MSRNGPARIPPTPGLLIAAANALVGFGEDHPGRSRGQLVHRFLQQVGVREGAAANVPWHTAFAHHVGYWSHYDQRSLRSSWPLPLSASCAELAAFAEREGVLAHHPVQGDLFLLWAPPKRAFVRTGIIVQVGDDGHYTDGDPYHQCITIEGDTNPVRAPRGGRTVRLLRVLSAERGDRFVRWTALAWGARGAKRADEATPEVEERAMAELREAPAECEERAA